MKEEPQVIFRETQPFRQVRLLWVIIIGLPILATVFGYCALHYDLFGRPLQAGDSPNPIELWSAVVVALASLAITIPLCSSYLVTEVRGDGLFIRCAPFSLRFYRVALSNVNKVEAKVNEPIGQVDESQPRLDFKRKWVILHNYGIRIEYKDGNCFLLSSNQPERLAEAIRELINDQ